MSKRQQVTARKRACAAHWRLFGRESRDSLSPAALGCFLVRTVRPVVNAIAMWLRLGLHMGRPAGC